MQARDDISQYEVISKNVRKTSYEFANYKTLS